MIKPTIRKIIRPLAFAAALLLVGRAFSQESPVERVDLSLEQALVMVERANPDLVVAAISLETVLREYNARMSAYVPSFNARFSLGLGSALFLKGDSGHGSGAVDPTSIGLNLGMSLPLGNDLRFDIRQKGSDLESQRLTLAAAGAQVRRDTRKAYFSLVKAGEDLELRKRALKLAGDRFNRTKSKYDQGLSSEQEYLRAELAVQTLRPAVLQAEADRAKLMLALARILGFPGKVDLAVSANLDDLADPIKAEEAENGRERLSDGNQIKKYNIDLDGLRASLERAKAALLPTFTASLAWSSSVKGAFTADAWAGLQDSASLSLGMSLPIDSWIPNSKAALARMRIEDSVKIQEQKRRTALRALNDNLDQILSDIGLQKENMNLNRRAIVLAQKSMDWTRQAYDQGRAGIKDLEDAEDALFGAQYNLIANRYKYLTSLCDLAYLLE